MMRTAFFAAAALLLALVVPTVTSADRMPGSNQGGAPASALLMPPPGMSGMGTAHFTINPGQQQVCYQITTTGVSLPVTAAHIHVTGGAIAVGLFSNPTNTTADSFSGCVFASRDVAQAILENPSNYYVNLHTPKESGGLATILSGTLTMP